MTKASPKSDRAFFRSAAIWLVALCAIGFAPTFYLRSLFGVYTDPLPANHIAHGVASSLWILLFLTQSVLISAERCGAHRLMGVAGLVLGAALVFFGFDVVLAKTAAGLKSVDEAGFNLTEFVLFLILALAGAGARKHPFLHKRLMLAAATVLAVAAADRVSFLIGLGEVRLFRKLLAAAPLISLIAYDLFALRKPPVFALALFALQWSVIWFFISDLIFLTPAGEKIIAALIRMFGH